LGVEGVEECGGRNGRGELGGDGWEGSGSVERRGGVARDGV